MNDDRRARGEQSSAAIRSHSSTLALWFSGLNHGDLPGELSFGMVA